MSLEQRLRGAADDGNAAATRRLIKNGADVDAAEEEGGWAALHYAANGNTTDHLDVAMELLQAGANVDLQNGQGETPLHLAAARGNEAMVDGLLQFNASLVIEDNRGRTPYFVALQPHPNIAIKLNPSRRPPTQQPRLFFGRTRPELNATAGIGEEKRQQEERAKAEQELRDAAQEGDLVGVEEILDLVEGIRIDAVDDQGNSALWLACFTGRVHVVEELLARGADPAQARRDSAATPLHIAAERGYVKIVKLLWPKLSKRNIDARDNIGRTALFIAAEAGHTDVIEALLEGKADINLGNEKSESPLFISASKGHVEAIRSLLNAPEPQRSSLEVDAADMRGYTPLHSAAKQGNVMIATLLLDRQSNKEARDNVGHTPLFLAAEAGQTRMVTALLKDYEANVDALNDVGETPLYVASLKGHVSVVEALISNGADTEAAADGGFTPLMIAAQEGQSAVMLTLLDSGVNIHAANSFGETPLLIAALEGYNYAVAILLEHGANLKAAQNLGRTALHIASRDGHVGVVTVLLKAAKNAKKSSADAGVRSTPLHMIADTKGETALHLAVRFGHVSVVELLLKHDEDITKELESLPQDAQQPVSSLIYGPLVDAPNKFGWSAIHVAVDSQQEPALTALIRHRANVNASDTFGNKPLHLASRMRDHRLVSHLLKVPGIDIEGVNVNGRTALHFASACVRPNALARILTDGADHQAQDKNGMRALDVLGDQTVCNPGYSIGSDMCIKEHRNGSFVFKGDLCPVAVGTGHDRVEAEAVLQVARNKTVTSTPVVMTTQFGPSPMPSPNAFPAPAGSGSNEITLPMLAALVPMLGVVLFLIAAIFVLARKRQKQLDRAAGRRRRRRSIHGRYPDGSHMLPAHSGKKGVGYFQKGMSPRTAESIPSDYKFIADPRNMQPLQLDEVHSSPLDDTVLEESSEEESSSGDDSCGWSDESDEIVHNAPVHPVDVPNVLPRGTGEMREIHVVRTMSKSSSDGEMHEREKRDAVGPLPSMRSPKNKHARGWLVGRSSSGRRLIGLKGPGRPPPAPQGHYLRINPGTSHRDGNQPMEGSGSLPNIDGGEDHPALSQSSDVSMDRPPRLMGGRQEQEMSAQIEMQRQWSWS